MPKSALFKWRHYFLAIILRCIRWYCRYSLSYRDVEELSQERGLRVDHSTIYRWVQAYSPLLDKRCRPHLRPPSDSWRVDEVYVNIKGRGRWLYRAVDKQGDTLDFLLTAKRDALVRILLQKIEEALSVVLNYGRHNSVFSVCESFCNRTVYIPCVLSVKLCK